MINTTRWYVFHDSGEHGKSSGYFRAARASNGESHSIVRLIHTCDVTHIAYSYVLRDSHWSFIRVIRLTLLVHTWLTFLIHTCDTTMNCTPVRLIHTCDVTHIAHSYAWHVGRDSHYKTHSHVWRDSHYLFIREARRTWLISRRDMPYAREIVRLIHTLFICVTWLTLPIHMSYMTHS